MDKFYLTRKELGVVIERLAGEMNIPLRNEFYTDLCNCGLSCFRLKKEGSDVDVIRDAMNWDKEF